MIRILLTLGWILLTGCTSYRDYDSAMWLPDGFKASYSTRTETATSFPSDAPTRKIDCWIERHENPQTARYCGYTIHVSADAFSFDMVPRPVESDVYGTLRYTVSGSGDYAGAEIYLYYEQEDGPWWMSVLYEIDHKADL